MEGRDLGTVLVVGGRQDDGDGLAAHGVRFDGEPVRESVVTADHHVSGSFAGCRCHERS
ncbi:hypothetical protein [Streptomyces sp. NPDC001068]|uniref:hypothetical protein n=1 Tax=Streptomyces sp. NPDC001068 TaxID=3364544 RepID=UPI0036B643F5